MLASIVCLWLIITLVKCPARLSQLAIALAVLFASAFQRVSGAASTRVTRMRNRLWTLGSSFTFHRDRGGVVQPHIRELQNALVPELSSSGETCIPFLSLPLLRTVHQARDLLLKNKNGK